jgi:predicted DNA-binding helix-hairpin-helix protein
LEPWVKRPSLSTQFVVGPAGEADKELLTTVNDLYQEAKLARAYFQAFNPVSGTTFAEKPKTPMMREHRLYQADWLLRFYGFELNELPFDTGGNLPLTSDPKILWAQQHLHQPVEINQATRRELLRVPGIGPKTAESIITARREIRISNLQQLKQIGVWTKRAAPYILLNGRQPGHQMRLAGI